jgi:uncharacterized protein (TIGR03000 family)
MYSVVLMMALAGGAETPDHGGRNGGCQGGGGLFSRGCDGGRGGLFHRDRGGCHGGRGGLFNRNRGGCHGGYNGCHGGYNGCHGGAGYGCHGGHHGCHGGVVYGCHGGHHGCHGGGVIIDPKGEKKEMPGKKVDQVSATILVNLPADAKLTVDGSATSQTSSSRLFVTPALEPEAEFTYTLIAEIARNGESVRQTQLITVRAGEQTRVTFDFTQPNAVSTR